MSIARRAKRMAEHAVVTFGVDRIARRFKRSASLVLAYHNVLPDSVVPPAERSLHLKLSDFRRQIDVLQETHDVVPLVEALTPNPTAGRRPRVAVSFDDAYYGAVSLAIPELIRRGLPSTVFVAPGFINRQGFWWDMWVTSDGTLPARLRDKILHEFRGLDEEVRTHAKDLGLHQATIPQEALTATEEELDEVVRTGLVTVGSHTWSHPNLSSLSDDVLIPELARPIVWLRERFATAALSMLAYPYGLSSDRVEAAANEVGYSQSLRVEGGWVHGRTLRPHQLPRLNVPAGISLPGFVTKVSGLGT